MDKTKSMKYQVCGILANKLMTGMSQVELHMPKLPSRKRENIKRSRNSTEVYSADKNTKEIIAFAKATGLCKHEIAMVRYEDSCIRNGRIASRAIASRIEKVCQHAGLPVKSSHDIRRTVASELNAKEIPLDEIRRILGHLNEQTTLSYIYNPYPEDKTNQLIEDALG